MRQTVIMRQTAAMRQAARARALGWIIATSLAASGLAACATSTPGAGSNAGANTGASGQALGADSGSATPQPPGGTGSASPASTGGATPSQSPSATKSAPGKPSHSATPSASPSTSPGVITAADNGKTILLRKGQSITVQLDGMTWDQPTLSGAALTRLSDSGGYPTTLPARAVFLAAGPGTAQLTSMTDAKCLHATPACMIAQRSWRVTVSVS